MDSRKDKRFEQIKRVLIKEKAQPDGSAADHGINAYTHDISLSGAWICSRRDFPVGYVIRIVLDLGENGQPLEMDGEVIWSRKSANGRDFDIGVEFIPQISETILLLIGHFYGKKVGVPSSVS